MVNAHNMTNVMSAIIRTGKSVWRKAQAGMALSDVKQPDSNTSIP